MSSFMKKPCEQCPFRRDVKPFLHPERGDQLAYHAHNPYNEFTCHKTTEYNEETEEMEVINTSKSCAGFLTLMANELGEDSVPKDFKPSYDLVYTDSFEMSQAYEDPDEWEKIIEDEKTLKNEKH